MLFRSGTNFSFLANYSYNTGGVDDTNVLPATHYWYRVGATNSVGASPWSNIADVTTRAAGAETVPLLPENSRATAYANYPRIDLSWTDVATNESGYVIERGQGNEASYPIAWLPRDATNYVDLGASPGVLYSYSIKPTNSAGGQYGGLAGASASSIPTPWNHRDVAQFFRQFDETCATWDGQFGSFSVIGIGQDIYGTSDEFNFVYQQVSGDVTIIATVRTSEFLNTYHDPWARGGLMIRETLEPGSRNATVFITPEHNGLTWRTASGGDTQFIPGPSSFYQYGQLKLVRSGNVFLAYWSDNGGQLWTLIGSANIPMATSVYVGMVSCSHGGAPLVAKFSNVSLTAAYSEALPPPWQNRDIGAVGLLGSAKFSQNSFSVQGSGSDIWTDIFTNVDQFHFVYQVTTNRNIEIIARLTALDRTDPWAKAGVMIHDSRFHGGAPNAFVMFTPDHGTGFQARSFYGGETSYSPGPPLGPVWLRLRRQGDLYSGYVSADGANWQFLGSQTIYMDGMLVGLAVTSHNNRALATAKFENVTVTPLPP